MMIRPICVKRFTAKLLLTSISLMAVPSPRLAAFQNSSADSRAETGVSLSQFRQMISRLHPATAPSSSKKAPTVLPTTDFSRADETFLRIVTTQARLAAARQSLDRLAGWNKAIQPRIDNQNIPALDVEILRLAEKREASQVAYYEGMLRDAREIANRMAGRELSQPFVAMVAESAANAPDNEGLNTMEKEVLARGRDLLAKLFQSYAIGGIGVTDLLWHEREAWAAESEYRVWAAHAGFQAAKSAADKAR